MNIQTIAGSILATVGTQGCHTKKSSTTTTTAVQDARCAQLWTNPATRPLNILAQQFSECQTPPSMQMLITLLVFITLQLLFTEVSSGFEPG